MKQRVTHPTYSVKRHIALRAAAAAPSIPAGSLTHYHLRRLGWLEFVPGTSTQHERITAAGLEKLAEWERLFAEHAKAQA